MTYIVPDELYYTKNHEWAAVDETVVTVGLTGFHLNQIGEVLYEDPAKLNDDPLNEGWIVKIEMEREADLANLMRAPEYRKYIHTATAAYEKEFSGKGIGDVEQ